MLIGAEYNHEIERQEKVNALSLFLRYLFSDMGKDKTVFPVFMTALSL